ncbi:MFS transporter [Candidatus Tisiphia endosymbiont of Nemotelus uliginosus]|uniref:MFS transporter n=1 Tax=Candidatus Tisiphia endosymbiont of Nemotelus uliginosus TaxID=3077926 RepID=UPI0035C92117
MQNLNIEANTYLNQSQKEAVGLLSIGTFLEYFDLMLYVHMAVLLNELFFPKADPHTAALFSAAAFCSTYLLRPFGALIFGWIGDSIGRKATVVITTFMMAISCIVMANLPTYAQIGSTATWVLTICRMIQGMTSMGEVVGAELYLTEITKPPIQYPTVTLVAVCCILGGTVALGIASLVTSYGLSWRIAFWIGTGVAMIGAIARTALRETPEFVNAKRQIHKVFQDANIDKSSLQSNTIYNMRTSKKTFLAVFLIHCAYPVCFYFTYIHCGNILKNSFGYTTQQIIHQNFIVSIIALVGCIIIAYISYYIHPIKILKAKLLVFLSVILITPYLFNNITDPLYFTLLQSLFGLLLLYAAPATSLLYKYIPIFKRFTYGGLTYALSRTLMHVITSFGLVYLTEQLGHYGLLVIIVPVTLGFAFGVYHIGELEQADDDLQKDLEYKVSITH